MSTPFSGTDEQRANLLKLAEYLERPQLQAKFDMRAFTQFPEDAFTPMTECGSVGCAVGHGPYAGVPKLPDEFWDQYSERAFTDDSNEWRWLFSFRWRSADNTPFGAASRIRWLLDKGLPENWEEQLDGKVPLCYVTPREV